MIILVGGAPCSGTSVLLSCLEAMGLPIDLPGESPDRRGVPYPTYELVTVRRILGLVSSFRCPKITGRCDKALAELRKLSIPPFWGAKDPRTLAAKTLFQDAYPYHKIILVESVRPEQDWLRAVKARKWSGTDQDLLAMRDRYLECHADYSIVYTKKGYEARVRQLGKDLGLPNLDADLPLRFK